MNLLERVFLGKDKINKRKELEREIENSISNTNQEIQVMESGARLIRTMTEAMAMMEPKRDKDSK